MMIANGELTKEVLSDRDLKKWRERGQEEGTRSQVLRYLDAEGQWLVEVHQYLRPDGTLGGSGTPDPKRLRLEDKIVVVEPSPGSDP
ncbi:MAG: hypothetical protein Q8Q00_05525 [Dehalococcoidia bacterium]|nr:hypothetical protein [Dehalococcoidia bacterium]